MERQIRIWSFADVDRSGKVRWTAEELGYQVEEARLDPGGQAAEAYRLMNPYEQIPTAELGGETLIESTAICLVLAEKHPEAGLIPAGKAERKVFWQSLNVSTNTLELPLVMYYLSTAGIVDAGWKELTGPPVGKRIRTFAGQVPGAGFICGDFSIADICAAYCLRIGVQAGLLEYEGPLRAYLERLRERPAARAARFFDSLKA